MRLIVRDSQVDQWVACYIAKRITDFAPTAERPFVLGLPTGGSVLGVYQTLVYLYKEGHVNFEHVVTFNMDEYVGLPADHPQSYARYMHANFFDHVNIAPQNIHLLNGVAADIEAECDRYEGAIRKHGPIHLFLGGVGVDGHIAFNEPGSSLKSRTRDKDLTLSTRLANQRFFSTLDEVPKKAMTVGVGTIMDAQEVVILATGAHKARAVYAAVEGSINHLWTVSVLQMHNRMILAADLEACADLRYKTVTYFQDTEAPLCRQFDSILQGVHRLTTGAS